MTRIPSKTLAVSALALFLFAGTKSASAEHYESRYRFGARAHIDELADEVKQRANNVCWELHRNYRYQSDYGTVYREAKEMWAIAGHIHDLAHNRSMGNRIKRNIAELDELFHHLEDDFSDWGVNQPHGHGHYNHGRGYHLARKMAGLEQALHHLMDDMGVRPADQTFSSSRLAPNRLPTNRFLRTKSWR